MNNTTAQTTDAQLATALGIANRAAISLSEFGKLHGKSRGYAYRLVARGELKTISPGGRLAVPLAEVLRFARGE